MFRIDATSDEPRLRWIGCIEMPPATPANSVATYSDGTVVSSVLTHSGTLITDAVVVFARQDTSRPMRTVTAPGFMPDNVHWDGSRLILAGMQSDEPNCGGRRKILDGKADDMRCHRRHVVAEMPSRSHRSETAAISAAELKGKVNRGVSARVVRLALVWCLLSACGRSSESIESDQTTAGMSASASTVAEFVGSADCAKCHREQFNAWRGSHHDLAMQAVSRESMLGDFDDARLEHHGDTTRFFRRGEEYWVETRNAQRQPEAFRIAYTLGVYPLQQYLVAFPGGRYQALTIAWDSRPKQQGGQRWFHLQPNARTPHDDPLHWTGPYYNWNSRCAECHTTGLRKNYDAGNDSYSTVWTDIDVGCEACHGPGSKHLAWAAAGAAAGSQDTGLAAHLAPGVSWVVRQSSEATAQAVAVGAASTVRSPEQRRWQRQLDACGPCHSRRDVIAGPDELHQIPAYHDAYVLSLPTPPLYHTDGQILDEDYELGSFLQSKMHAQGVVCSNCHDPHSLRLRAPGNEVCAQCHNRVVFDAPAHHHHSMGSAGAQCANCHMPSTTFMVVDQRRDHSIRIPRPDLSVQFDTPNACSQCHSERGSAWAADRVRSWLRVGRNTAPHFGAELANHDISAWLRLAADEAAPAVARAAALSRLAQHPSDNSLALAVQELKDQNPLVRRAALDNFDAVEPALRAPLLLPLASDVSRSVRMRVAASLASTDLASLPADQRSRLNGLFTEYLAQMSSTADMQETLVRVGLFQDARNNLGPAEQAYRRALQLDRTFIPAYLNLADLYFRQDREDEARSTLEAAVSVAPQAAAAHHALGLQRVRARAYDEAVRHLRRAYELAPAEPEYGYTYAVALFDTGSRDQAIDLLKWLSTRWPSDERMSQALVDFLRRQGRSREAEALSND